MTIHKSFGEARAGVRLLAVLAALFLPAAAAVCVSSCVRPVRRGGARLAPVVAVVTSFTVDCQLRRAVDDFLLAGGAGTSLLKGDTVYSGDGGKVMFFSTGGIRVQAGPDTVVRIASGTGERLRLFVERGEVLARGDSGGKGFALSTPAATAVARDADVRMVVRPGGVSTLTVTRGKASFMDGNEKVAVGETYRSTAAPGAGPQEPVAAGEEDPGANAFDYAFYVWMQIEPYFRDRATRERIESDARSRLEVETLDPWPHVNLGRARLDDGALDDARAGFNRALELDPQFSQALEGLGKVALLEGGWEEAARFFTRAGRAKPDSLEALNGLGYAYLGLGDIGDAENWHRDALDVDAEDARTMAALGVLSLLKGDTGRASERFRTALSIDGHLAVANYGLGVLGSLKRRLTTANACFRRALEDEKKDSTLANTIGDNCLVLGRPGAAERYFKEMNRNEGRSLRAAGYQNLGAVEMIRGDFKGALRDNEKSLDLQPDRVPAMVNLAEAHLALGDFASALPVLQRVVQLRPDDCRAHELLARAYWQLGMYPEAASEGRRAVELNPAAWLPHAVLGLSLKAAGAAAEGEAELGAAARMAPKGPVSAAGHAFRGHIHSAEKDYEGALREYREASRSAPASGIFHRYAGDVLVLMKSEDRALKEYRKAVRLNPADTVSRVALASILRSRGDKREAVEELERAVEQAPNDPTARLALAESLLGAGDIDGVFFHLQAAWAIPGVPAAQLASIRVVTGNAYDRKVDFGPAIAAYREAVALDPARGDAWFYLAGDLERTGDTAGAVQAYLKAVELCAARGEWSKFREEAAEKLRALPR